MRSCAILVVLGAAGCGAGAFACEQSGDCQDGDAAGVCQPEGFCSFPDPDCASGQRFGDHSGRLSGTCVPGPQDTTGTSMTTTATASQGEATLDPTLESVGEVSTSGGPATLDGEAESSASNATVDEGSTGDPLDPTLLLWFQFEEPAAEGLVNDGVLGGTAPCHLGFCPGSEPGVVGQAAIYDGVDDCAVYPWTAELDATEFTLALWTRRDVFVSGYDGVFTKPVGDGAFNTWRVYFTTPGGMQEVTNLGVHVGLADNTGVDVVVEYTLATWTHFAATWDGTALSLWIDGLFVGTMPTDVWEVDEHGVTIGCDDDVPIGITHFLHGSIDDVRMYARVLDEAEIAELAAMGTP